MKKLLKLFRIAIVKNTTKFKTIKHTNSFLTNARPYLLNMEYINNTKLKHYHTTSSQLTFTCLLIIMNYTWNSALFINSIALIPQNVWIYHRTDFAKQTRESAACEWFDLQLSINYRGQRHTYTSAYFQRIFHIFL